LDDTSVAPSGIHPVQCEPGSGRNLGQPELVETPPVLGSVIGKSTPIPGMVDPATTDPEIHGGGGKLPFGSACRLRPIFAQNWYPFNESVTQPKLDVGL